MMDNAYFKSLADQDRAPVVICAKDHTVVYMNPAAKERYRSSGGGELVGKSIMLCHGRKSGEQIASVVDWFDKSPENNLVYTSFNEKENKDVYMVALRNDAGELIGYYEKHEYRNRETMPFYDLR